MTKDLQKRVIFGGIALLFFIPTVMVGGVFFQIVIGLIAMLGVHELLKMKGLLATEWFWLFFFFFFFSHVSGLRPDFADRGLPPLPSSRWQYDCLWFGCLDSHGDNCSCSELQL